MNHKMIISDNPNPKTSAFQTLMRQSDAYLNADAKINPNKYTSKGGSALESVVMDALEACARGSEFEGTFELISGHRFPDIVAAKLYGVEVKSTNSDHWTSTGSSILESTRVPEVNRIYMTFGKLGGKSIEFLSKPYEECLSDIAVTHMPRYLIDMHLQKGKTIFDKMKIPYEELRQMDNPVTPVAQYYRSQLKPGQSLWWTGDNSETVVPVTVKLWNTLSKTDKDHLAAQGLVLFPEVLKSGDNNKYNRYSLWLVTEKGIVSTNIRDSFSAGGQETIRIATGVEVRLPAVFRRIKLFRNKIERLLNNIDEVALKQYWGVSAIKENRLQQWCELIANIVGQDPNIGYERAQQALASIFSLKDWIIPEQKYEVDEKPSFIYSKSSLAADNRSPNYS